MKNILYIVIILILGLWGGLSLWQMFNAPKQNSLDNKIPIQPSPSMADQNGKKETFLSVDAQNVTFSGQVIKIPILITTGTNQVSAVKLAIEYDSQSMSSVEVQPGPFLPNATMLEKQIDQKTGTINCSLGTLKPSSGDGVLVYVTGTVLQDVHSLRIDFLPETEVAAIGHDDTVLNKSTGSTLMLN